jgi:RNA 2',3'-cyclic 3'-phosphodiesterase
VSQPACDEPFVRAFVAVEIPDSVRRPLAAVQAELKRAGAHVAWVRPENIHVSLLFLGDTARDHVAPLSAALDRIAPAHAPFAVRVAGLGTFGSPRSPRVLWAGLEPSRPLAALQAQVAEAAVALGLSPDLKEFKPHLTLGRVRSPRGREELAAALRRAGQPDFGNADVGRVVLVQSRLKPDGAEYSILHAAALSGPAAGG